MIAGGTYSSAPVNTVAPVVSGTATRGQTLSSTTGTWTGKPDPTFAYQWQRAGSNIGGATSSTYTLVSADVGNAIRCVVTATNVVAAVSANSNATAAVAGVVAGAPTIGSATATGATTATVSYSAPADNGGLTITSYTATSSPGGVTGTLSQAGSGTITVSGLTSDVAYTFTVTATNSAGTSAASAASNSVTPILQGSLWSWGVNNRGQLGLNSATYIYGTDGVSSPTQIGSTTTWKLAKTARYWSWAIKSDGTMWAWGGTQGNGQLGLGVGTQLVSSPTQIGALTNWLKVSGQYNPVAIKTDGTIWSWGFGGYGSIGNGSYTSQSSPVQIGADTNWYQADASSFNVAAIKTNGTLWMWGKGSFGALGQNNTAPSPAPVQVGTLTNWLQVSCGQYWTTAIKTDGTMWSWGRNKKYNLGQGANTINKSSPVQVGSDTNWSKVATTDNYGSAAIKTDGTLWLIGTANYLAAPTQLGALTNWTSVSAGGEDGAPHQWWLARTSSGNLYAWGTNVSGYLGLNNTTEISYLSPTLVGSSTNWTNLLAAGRSTALAIRT